VSHIATIACEVRDLDAFEAAVRRLGGEFRRGQPTYRCYPGGYQGDTPLPAGMTLDQWGKCDHAARFAGCDYEVGLVRQPNGTYQLRWDYWSPGGLLHHLGGEAAPRLVQAYAVEKAKAEARRMGLEPAETTLADGTIKITLRA
jgi:hypothetical protein